MAGACNAMAGGFWPTLGARGDGVWGNAPVSEQAPAFVTNSARPVSAGNLFTRVGTFVRNNLPAPMQPAGTCCCTGYPIFSAPASAVLQPGQRSTTADGCGANPTSIPAVGVISPQAGSRVQQGSQAAPRSKLTGWIFAAVVLIALWTLAGGILRRAL